MPYIKQEKRDILDPHLTPLLNSLRELESDDPSNSMEGNINYIFTRVLKHVYKDGGYTQGINPAMGVLLCVALEYYRKEAAPYEDQKEFENGIVE
jgi:hypothetical protein